MGVFLIMPSLYKPEVYPKELKSKLRVMPPLAIEIANRWVLGWSETVKNLIASNEYLEALQIQERLERAALIHPGMEHLSAWEKTEQMGLSQRPPEPSSQLEV